MIELLDLLFAMVPAAAYAGVLINILCRELHGDGEGDYEPPLAYYLGGVVDEWRRLKTKKKLSPEQVRELPVYQLPGDGDAPINPMTMAAASYSECGICLEEYEGGNRRCRLLPACGHAFHVGCVDPWLLTRSATCPMCRADVVVVTVEEDKEE